MSEISYSKKNDRIECVRYKDWRKSYPPHTHTAHMTVGYIEEGRVCMVLNGEAKIYGAGEQFQIPPNTLHEIKTVGDECYCSYVVHVLLREEDSAVNLFGILFCKLVDVVVAAVLNKVFDCLAHLGLQLDFVKDDR